MINPFSLEGKTILVTGASSGIGRAIAIQCSKIGAKIIISGRSKARLQQTFDSLEGEGHTKIVADLTSSEALNNLVNEICPLDGVVLCAGIGYTVPVMYAKREILDSVFNINYFSTVELLRLIYKKKRIKKKGSIIVISSVAGIYNFNVGNSVYGASKAALNSMVKFCAKEFSKREIRVNCICPGMVETPFTMPDFSISKEQLEADKDNYPLKRYGQPNEIAYGAIYLLSDAAAWITGQNLVIDGGLTI